MPMTRPWQEIVALYANLNGEQQAIRALQKLAERISETQLGKGLFGWTSMLDLCIVQTEVSYPYDGPLLRLSPVSADQIELRYIDTHDRAQQWHRTVNAEQAFPQLSECLRQLHWFPADVLASIDSNTPS